jgi:hypothetical protein
MPAQQDWRSMTFGFHGRDRGCGNVANIDYIENVVQRCWNFAGQQAWDEAKGSIARVPRSEAPCRIYDYRAQAARGRIQYLLLNDILHSKVRMELPDEVRRPLVKPSTPSFESAGRTDVAKASTVMETGIDKLVSTAPGFGEFVFRSEPLANGQWNCPSGVNHDVMFRDPTFDLPWPIMVANDVIDRKSDQICRPFRPSPYSSHFIVAMQQFAHHCIADMSRSAQNQCFCHDASTGVALSEL